MKESADATENDEVIYVVTHKQPLLIEAGHLMSLIIQGLGIAAARIRKTTRWRLPDPVGRQQICQI